MVLAQGNHDPVKSVGLLQIYAFCGTYGAHKGATYYGFRNDPEPSMRGPSDARSEEVARMRSMAFGSQRKNGPEPFKGCGCRLD